ncbi:PUA-like domain-containing protein [Suillus lakei]|nr:PUA-like domain-containing protein [Suillus lakei]
MRRKIQKKLPAERMKRKIQKKLPAKWTTTTDPNKIARKVAKEVRASRARMARRFGEIPGVPVGATWTYRKDCYDVGVHRHLKAGIQGVKALGACSIVVSGSYDDDNGFRRHDPLYRRRCVFAIWATGLYADIVSVGGGSNSDGWPKRPGPQVRDQKWTGWGNEALRKSCDTGKPVRVVRSCKFVSDFSPLRGYRYDGLYTVTHACREKDNTWSCLYLSLQLGGKSR